MNAGKIALITSAIALPIVGGIAYYQYAKNSIDFRFNGIDLPPGNLSTILHVKIQFQIHSTLGFPFTIESSTFNIFNGMDMLGSATQSQPLRVPNKGTVIYEANAVIDPSILGHSVFDYVLGAIGGGSAGTNFLVKGIAKVKLDIPVLKIFAINIPVDENYSL
jgi:hypothetical protein